MNNLDISQNPGWLVAINETLRKNVQDVLEGKINDTTARCNLKKTIIGVGYHPETAHIEPNSPEDFLSDARINLTIRTNVELVQGQRNSLQAQNHGVLTAFPADELFRVESRPFPRDWLNRWRMAGQRTGDPIGTGWTITPDNRMIALKNHPIWKWIGRSKLFPDALDVNWPPFALNSGMWVRDVDRAETVKIGLLTPGQSVQPDKVVLPTPFLLIESKSITEYLWNEPTPCDHCGEEKPFKLLDACDACGESICPDCAAKGCACSESSP